MSDIKVELESALTKAESNDSEMRRQLENAARKIDNYKEKLLDK